MLSSISPVGEASRNQRWAITAVSFTGAAVTAGALTGLTVAALGRLAVGPDAGRLGQGVALGVLLAVLVVGLALDARLFGLRLPTMHRQVNERWLGTYRGWVYGAGFGAQLGTGLVTVVVTSLTYVMYAGLFLSGRPMVGFVAGSVYGFVRAMPVLAAGRLRTVTQLREQLGRLDRLRPAVARAAVGVTALAALVTAVGFAQAVLA